MATGMGSNQKIIIKYGAVISEVEVWYSLYDYVSGHSNNYWTLSLNRKEIGIDVNNSNKPDKIEVNGLSVNSAFEAKAILVLH